MWLLFVYLKFSNLFLILPVTDIERMATGVTPPVVIMAAPMRTVTFPVMTVIIIVVTVVATTVIVITLAAVTPGKRSLWRNLNWYFAGSFFRHIIQQGSNQVRCVMGFQKLRCGLLVAIR